MTFPFKLTVAFQLSLTSKPQILLLRLEVKLDYLHPNVMTLVSLLSYKSESSTVPGIYTLMGMHAHTQACCAHKIFK